MSRKLNWIEYFFSYCLMTGWRDIGRTFRIWSDLMKSNYEVYDLPRTVEDPEAECIDWFWITLGEDNVLDKEFCEYLFQMADDVETGKIESYPYFTEDHLKWVDEILDGVDLNEKLPDEEDT